MKISEMSSTEFNPYYKGYIDLVGEEPLIDSLVNGLARTRSFFENIPAEKLEYRYDEGKWTPKEILLHLIDAERVFCYRALFFARAKNAELVGFDENIFAESSNANTRSLENILEEYTVVRKASIALFNSFSGEALQRTGKANNSELSVRAAGFIIGGHEKHHCRIISERYL